MKLMKIKFAMRSIACLLITVLLFGVLTIGVSAAPDAGLPVVQGEWQVRLPDLLKATPTRKTLSVGGDTFGVRLFAEGVFVVGVANEACPAAKAGIQKKDMILKINNRETRTVADVVGAIESSEGKELALQLRRGETEMTLTLTPVKEGDKYRAGIWVRDNAAGIGTITFIDPRTGAFGGLGHGICDGESGVLLPLDRGAVLETEISDVIRGEEGAPGELRGYLCSKKLGTLLKNCDCGVFGILSPIPTGEVMEIGTRGSVHEGDAILRCTLGDGTAKDYHVELSHIEKENTGTKCFAVHVTDPELLSRTGGIVQGMSGSPLLQDGKLIGAVTHVLIGDPTRGYGIFIENMLAAMPTELT